jgi:hypothetical protein
MIAAAVLAAGLVAAVTMTGAAQATSTTLAYSCQFSSGTVQASVRVTANLPATATVGKPVQPTDASVTVTFPPSVASGLSRSNAATVTGAVRLDLAVTGGASPSDSVWTGLAVPSTTVPAAGNMVLTASGPVPAATTAKSGTVTFIPGVLDLALAQHTSAGTTSGAAPLEASCAPATGQDAALGSTTVSGPAGDTAADPAAARAASATAAVTPSFSICSKISQGPQSPGPVSGPYPANEYTAGYTDASKLDGSALIGPAFVTGQFWFEGGFTSTSNGVCSLTEVQPDFNGSPSLPPVTATFAGFGFVPVTATVQLTEVGLKNPPPLTNVSYQDNTQGVATSGEPLMTPFVSITTARLLLRVLSAKVNGVSLDVGAHCQTATPLYTQGSPEDPSPATEPLIVLSGGNAPGDPVPVIGAPTSGGASTGDVTIPQFTGCGSGGDNLDPLFDASVSGPGNNADMITGVLCSTTDVMYCGSDSKADTEPLWTITGGGDFSVTGPVSISLAPALRDKINCASTVTGTMPDAAGPPRGVSGTFTWSFTGCTDPHTGDAWTVTEQGTASLSPSQQTKSGSTTTTTGTVSGMALTMTNGACTITAASSPEEMTFSYTNPPAPTLDMGNDIFATSVSTGCTSTWQFVGWAVDPGFAASPVTPATINFTSPTP